MSIRTPISKGRRFEVFKRDGFTCQYCGATPPGVLLHCDHIHPVADTQAKSFKYFCGVCWSLIRDGGRL